VAGPRGRRLPAVRTGGDDCRGSTQPVARARRGGGGGGAALVDGRPYEGAALAGSAVRPRVTGARYGRGNRHGDRATPPPARVMPSVMARRWFYRIG